MSDFEINPDVEVHGYLAGDCPNCGRHRLELYVDQRAERAVGVRCEKCGASWLLDPSKATFHGDLSQDDPLQPWRNDDNWPFPVDQGAG